MVEGCYHNIRKCIKRVAALGRLRTLIYSFVVSVSCVSSFHQHNDKHRSSWENLRAKV